MTNVKVFSDFNCPFCYIATGIIRRLKKDGVKFSVEWIPYETFPELPKEGKSLYDDYPKQQIINMYKMLNRHAKPYGIEFNDAYIKYNSRKALLAGEYAKSVGKYDAFAREIFKTAFTYVENIGDQAVLEKVAKNVGLDVSKMNEVINDGKYDGKLDMANNLANKFNIKEVPTFVINDKSNVTNIRNYKLIKKAIIEAKQ